MRHICVEDFRKKDTAELKLNEGMRMYRVSEQTVNELKSKIKSNVEVIGVLRFISKTHRRKKTYSNIKAVGIMTETISTEEFNKKINIIEKMFEDGELTEDEKINYLKLTKKTNEYPVEILFQDSHNTIMEIVLINQQNASSNFPINFELDDIEVRSTYIQGEKEDSDDLITLIELGDSSNKKTVYYLIGSEETIKELNIELLDDGSIRNILNEDVRSKLYNEFAE